MSFKNIKWIDFLTMLLTYKYKDNLIEDLLSVL